MTLSYLRWFIIPFLFLAACTPSSDELPTQARFPTLTEAPPTLVAQSMRTLPPSFTPTFTPTHTATLDPSVTASATLEPSVSPSATITNTPSPTATDLPTLGPDDRPLIAFALTAAAATVLPDDFQVPNFGGPDVTLIPQDTPTLAPGVPTAIPALATTGGLPIANACTLSPTGGFQTIYLGNPDIANQLGCATGAVQTNIPAAWQDFEGGIMIWLNGEILVFTTSTDTFQSLPDTFIEGSDPETSTETPPTGLFAPIRGFLKVWSGNSVIRTNLGWATNVENGTVATVQSFNNGRMIHLAGRPDVLITLAPNGSWLAFQGSY